MAGLNANKVAGGGNSDFKPAEPLEAGTYPARVVQILDLGVQPQREYKGQTKPPIQEINITYELTDEFMKDEDGEDIEDKPRWVSEMIPFHNLKAERAKSTQRYLALDPQQSFDGDFTQLIGEPCMVTIVQSKSKTNGRIYNNVDSISSMRAKDAARLPELVNPPKVFLLDDPDMGVFNSLPEFIQNKIKGNLNFKGSKLEALLGEEEEEDGTNEVEDTPPPKKEKKPVKKPALKESSEAPAWEEDGDDSPY